MSTRTFPQAHNPQVHNPFILAPISKKRNPFLDALQHIEYGHMTIVEPDGKTLEFSGHEKGPSAQLRLHDWEVLDDLIARGEMGFADAYIDGRWDTDNLPLLLTFGLVNSQSLEKFFYGRPLYALWLRLRYFLQGNTLSGSKKNIMAHYDLGNDFYSLWLDESMTYSCALFDGHTDRSLEVAQTAKYRRILEKLEALPGDHILEIGCGWGGFAEFAARHGMKVTAVTISEKQAGYAKQRIAKLGLEHLASIKVIDYRKMEGKFDHIVSIGMFEHVGEKYWPVYFDTVKNHLKPDGKAMIQTITLDDYLFESLQGKSGFMEQVIFPGGMLPSKSRFYAAAEHAGLQCREIYAFGQDYARTTSIWLSRFEEQKQTIKSMGYDETFIRLWRFYLSCCIASFTSHRTDVMQAELRHAI